MFHKIIVLSICLITLISCSFSSQKTKDKLEGKFVLLEGKSVYDSFSFKGKSTVVVESVGMEFVTSYVKDEEYLRIESEPSNLLLKIQSKDTIIGEGFTSGIYIKESLWGKNQAAKTSDLKQDTIALNTEQTDKQLKEKTLSQKIEDNIALAKKKEKQQKKKEERQKMEETEKKRLAEEQHKKEQAISNKVTGAFGMGSNSQSDTTYGKGDQGNPFGKSDHESKESVGYGFSLNGRSIGAGSFPRPAYTIQEEGRIIINITVDPKGNVIFAEIGKDTDIDNASMRKSALDAAKRAKFNSISGANNQSGTITYLYKLK